MNYTIRKSRKVTSKPGMMINICNPCTGEAEAGES
jgi:hypothetical protein